jgi:hypothetical protein
LGTRALDAIEDPSRVSDFGLLVASDNTGVLEPLDLFGAFLTRPFVLFVPGFSVGAAFIFCAIFDRDALPNELRGVSEPLKEEELVTRRGLFSPLSVIVSVESDN